LDGFDLAPLRMFAVQSRYPADVPEVTVEAAEAMIDLAERALTVIAGAMSHRPGGADAAPAGPAG
jgi:hypothetical protein